MAGKGNIEALKGIWDYVSRREEKALLIFSFLSKVDGDNNDEYLKELGVGMMARMVAKGLKPRLTIDENNGKWSLRTETTLKTMTVEFTPDVEFEETTGDGRELKVIQFCFITEIN